MKDEVYLSDDAVINLIDALSDEVINNGEQEALLLLNNELSDKDLVTIMKSNTLLTAFAMLLVKAVENRNIALARSVMEVWTTPKIRTLVSLAFIEEIEEAVEKMESGIGELERFINNQEDT